MAKVVDITEKLSFDDNPKLVIKGKEFEVNSDATTVLQMMGDFSNKSEIDASLSAYERMFSEEDRKKIEAMNIPFKDLMTIIEAGMNLVMGEENQGEQ